MHHWWCAIKAFFIRQINSRKSKKSEYNTITLMLTGALWKEVKSNKLKYHPCMRSSHTNIKYFDLLSTKSSIALNFVNTNAYTTQLHSYSYSRYCCYLSFFWISPFCLNSFVWWMHLLYFFILISIYFYLPKHYSSILFVLSTGLVYFIFINY